MEELGLLPLEARHAPHMLDSILFRLLPWLALLRVLFHVLSFSILTDF